MSSTGEPAVSREQGTQQGSSQEDGPPLSLGDLLKKLVDLLRLVARSARLMDDNVAGAQQIAEDIYGFINENVFISDGLLDPARYVDLYQLFETVWDEENDAYDIYDGVLDRYKIRPQEALTLAEVRADLTVLVGCRRQYISKLREFKEQVVTIEGYRSAQVEPPPQQVPAPG